MRFSGALWIGSLVDHGQGGRAIEQVQMLGPIGQSNDVAALGAVRCRERDMHLVPPEIAEHRRRWAKELGDDDTRFKHLLGWRRLAAFADKT
jgi:hypothetical protein